MRQADPSRVVTLVAMPRSGEVFIVRDHDGAQWLVSPPGAGNPERVSDDIVERAIVDHGFDASSSPSRHGRNSTPSASVGPASG